MISIGVNPPKTPVTEGSTDVAPASLPNVCKMPGPPAPFVPTPLPNLGRSGDQLKKATKKVLFEGKKVAIKGAYYMSMGDIASKGTGGGIISATTHGKTKFVAPGSMTVKAEGKNIQLLGDAMTNNGNVDNAATIPGNLQPPLIALPKQMPLNVDCEKKRNDTRKNKKWDECDTEELCAMVKGFNESKDPKKRISPSPSENLPPAKAKKYDMSESQRMDHNDLNKAYKAGLEDFSNKFDEMVKKEGPDSENVKNTFTSECRHKKWKEQGAAVPMPRGTRKPPGKPIGSSPDHVHDAGLGGPVSGPGLASGLKWTDSRVNQTMGAAMKKYKPEECPGGVKADPSCNCD
ncbi:MAG: DUF4150 domain-containing protein [Desulfobacterium sp.]|nr:DUF4150 domain-containing protein [Desulfobacterium sp.]